MYNIAILGCENTHANTFLNLIKEDEEFSDVRVLGAYSTDVKAAEKFSETYGVKVMKSPDELVGEVDAVMITARCGSKHLEFLEPYLASGVAVFVDKPITISVDDAQKMAELFNKYGNNFTGGSVMKYCDEIKKMKEHISNTFEKTLGGLVKAPIIKDSEYDGMYFYAPHLIEMMCQAFGRFPKSVISVKNDDCITAVFRYDSYDITAVYTEMNVSQSYYILCIEKDNCFGTEVKIENRYFREEFYHFYKSLKKEETHEDINDFFAPVYILEAMNRSLKSGKEEKILWKL